MITKETDNNIKSSSSPFHLEQHWCIQIENHNRNCTYAEIDSLLSKGILNKIDLEIIKLLGTWKYVNTHNITVAMNHMLPFAYQKEDYSRNLKKMEKAGILLRHYISSTECDEPHTPVSPLRFYSLSAGTRSFITPFLDIPDSYTSLLSDIQIIESLAVSQFMIYLHSLQNYQVTNCHVSVIRKAEGQTILIPAECYIRIGPRRLRSKLFILCARSRPDSLTSVVQNSCTLLRNLGAKESQQVPYMFIILLESLHDISIIHKRISMHSSDLYFSSIYYTTDNAIYTGQFSDSLYQCEETDGMFSINRIQLLSDEK